MRVSGGALCSEFGRRCRRSGPAPVRLGKLTYCLHPHHVYHCFYGPFLTRLLKGGTYVRGRGGTRVAAGWHSDGIGVARGWHTGGRRECGGPKLVPPQVPLQSWPGSAQKVVCSASRWPYQI